ncbi:MAG: DUF2993 domain-containing protein [Nakamurella sp.]
MRKLLIFVVVMVAVFVGADFGARYLATQKLGDALQSRLGVANPPEVAVGGFPFLTQAIAGSYGSVTAALPATTLGPLSNVEVTVILDQVRLPLSDAISGSVDQFTADAGRIRLSVPVASLAAAAGTPGLRITDANGTLVVKASVTALGQQFPITTRLDAAVTDSALILKTDSIRGDGLTLPPEVVGMLAPLVDLTVPLDALPFAVTSGRVTVSGTDVIVDATTGRLDLGTR